MKKRNKIIIISSSIVLLVGFFVVGILYYIDANKDKHEMDDLNEKNILSLSLKSNNSDNHNESIEIEMDFEERTIISVIKKENNKKEKKEVVLTDGALCYPDDWQEFLEKLMEY